MGDERKNSSRECSPLDVDGDGVARSFAIPDAGRDFFNVLLRLATPFREGREEPPFPPPPLPPRCFDGQVIRNFYWLSTKLLLIFDKTEGTYTRRGFR